jgi:hypothetical protein
MRTVVYSAAFGRAMVFTNGQLYLASGETPGHAFPSEAAAQDAIDATIAANLTRYGAGADHPGRYTTTSPEDGERIRKEENRARVRALQQKAEGVA